MASRLPNFLFIGPDRAGSTWLHEVLSRHPQVHVPKLKDSYFFDRYYYLGPAWYAGLFRHAQPQHLAVGEIAHDYLYSDLARARIRRDLPRIKLLITIRDPAERALSHWRFRRRSGATRLSFAEDFRHCRELREHGLYGEALKGWMDDFPAGQIHFLSFDRLRRAPRRFCGELARILEIDETLFPDELPEAIQQARQPRSVRAICLARNLGGVLRRFGFARAWGHLKDSALAQALLFRSCLIPVPDVATLGLEREFRTDRRLLENLTGRSWSELAGTDV